MINRIVEEIKKNELNIFSVTVIENGVEKTVNLLPVNPCNDTYSVSKAFIVTGVGMLYDDGLLKVEEKVVDIFRDKLPEKYDEKCISKKKAAELEPQESANVRVSMTYINDGSERTVMKSFKFTKNLNGDISVSNYCHDLYIQNGVEKEIKEGYQACRIFDRDFSDSIRKYCLFKGEHDLNIFNKPEAMSVLIETFSQLKNFDPYLTHNRMNTRKN